MPTRLAYALAEHWASSRKHPPPPAHRQDIADQLQQHLNHGADPDYLRRLAWWMAAEHPDWFDLSLAMTMSSAPQPNPTGAPGRPHRCPCRGALAAA
ncbi:hypothetical protein ACWDPF_33590 [Streptomyces albogriseolus]